MQRHGGGARCRRDLGDLGLERVVQHVEAEAEHDEGRRRRAASRCRSAMTSERRAPRTAPPPMSIRRQPEAPQHPARPAPNRRARRSEAGEREARPRRRRLRRAPRAAARYRERCRKSRRASTNTKAKQTRARADWRGCRGSGAARLRESKRAAAAAGPRKPMTVAPRRQADHERVDTRRRRASRRSRQQAGQGRAGELARDDGDEIAADRHLPLRHRDPVADQGQRERNRRRRPRRRRRMRRTNSVGEVGREDRPAQGQDSTERQTFMTRSLPRRRRRAEDRLDEGVGQREGGRRGARRSAAATARSRAMTPTSGSTARAEKVLAKPLVARIRIRLRGSHETGSRGLERRSVPSP